MMDQSLPKRINWSIQTLIVVFFVRGIQELNLVTVNLLDWEFLFPIFPKFRINKQIRKEKRILFTKNLVFRIQEVVYTRKHIMLRNLRHTYKMPKTSILHKVIL